MRATSVPVLDDSPAVRAESDDRLLQDALLALRRSGYGALSRIQCDVCDGVVELCGEVSTFHLKQMAQSVVLRLVNVRGVRNHVRVA
jgi:osmotically-inducible protein OsmY